MRVFAQISRAEFPAASSPTQLTPVMNSASFLAITNG